MDFLGSPLVPLLISILLLVGWAAKRREIGSMGGVLVLRKFEVNDTVTPAVVIEGRPSGLMAWLLTILRLDTLTTLTVTEYQVLLRRASLSGESRYLVPSTKISSTRCGYSQPIWMLILGAVAVLVSLVAGAAAHQLSLVVGGGIVAGLLSVLYFFQRRIVLSIETVGGAWIGLSFKPSMIEHVPIDLTRALQAINRINRIVMARSMTVP